MSLAGTLRLPAPEQPVYCADTELVLGMLACGLPLMLLPDLAWPGFIDTRDLPHSRPSPVAAVGSAGTTGLVGNIGGTSTGQARAERAGRHAGAWAPESAAERGSPYPDSHSGRHRLPLPDPHSAGGYARREGDFSAGQRAC